MVEGQRGTWKTVAVAALLVVVVVLASFWIAWEAVLRPQTIREVLEATNWRPGTTIDLEGTITAIRTLNTSYGPAVLLELDGGVVCTYGEVLGDPSADYAVGDRFRTSVQFVEYGFNGDPAVWASNLYCPFPALPLINGMVSDTISFQGGLMLFFRETDEEGWTTYEVFTRNGDAYAADRVPLSLKKASPLLDEDPDLVISSAAGWIVAAAVEYVRFQGGFRTEPVVDAMGSLADGTSRNGTIRFVDANANGFVDDLDEIQVRLSPTGGEWRYQTYLLDLGGFMSARGYVPSGRYILNGPTGPYETVPAYTVLQLRHAADRVNGTVASTIDVGTVRTDSSLAFQTCESAVKVGDADEVRGALSDVPRVFPGGTRVEYDDGNGDGWLNTGDRFLVAGLENRTRVTFGILCDDARIGFLEWIAGYGHIVGQLPAVELAPNTEPPYRVAVNVSYSHEEMAFNRTVRVSLWENETLLVDNASLADGIMGSFGNGSLSFLDQDGDGFLSSGDRFDLVPNPMSTYRIEVSLLFGYIRRSVEIT